MRLEDTVSVVTGAASGIGRATVIALARAGSDIVIADIDDAGAEEAANEIEAIGRRALFVRTDVTDREHVVALVEQAIAWQGRCDLFIANAGVGCAGLPHEFTHDEWDYLLAVNLWSAIWPLRTIVPHMLARGSGHLAFVSSGAGFEGYADRAPYNVAKFGIVGLAESVARSLKGTGIGVSLVVPGAVATDGWKRYVPANAAALSTSELNDVRATQREHSRSWPQPEVMANAIVDGIANDRYAIVQHNPFEPEWFSNVNRRKGEDLDAFVLGG
jgi:NAD(P)-dependent dehydrogenase (short-subunit alcohol dehydrogenase family)